MENRGILIAFEGIDGAGKTTQIELLGTALKNAGISTVLSKEPTDGKWGRRIRDSAQFGRMPLSEELEAFIEDRKEHIEKVIRPGLKRGDIVVLDRYFYSTIAYQGARGKDVSELIEMMRFAPVPDIVFLLDVSPTVGLSRISESRNETPNKFETLEELTLVRSVFLKLAEVDANIQSIDAHASVEFVQNVVLKLFIDGPLKNKRCAKSYDCDPLYCSMRLSGACEWFNIRQKLCSQSRHSDCS